MRWLCAIALLASAPAAAADEEEVLGLLFDVPAKVSGASKSRTPDDADRAAAHVVVVSGEEIRRAGWRTLAEVLQGVSEIHLEGQRYWPTASIRGTARDGDYNQRILVLLDGHVLNDAISDAVGIDDGLPLFAGPVLERVEVIVGPVSAVYGSNAFYGAVNLVTRKPEGKSGGALLETGSWGHGRALGWFTARSPALAEGPEWEVQTFATGGVVDGEPLAPSAGAVNVRLDESDWNRNGAAYLRARYGRVSVSAFGLGRRVGLTPSYYSELDDRDHWYERTRGTGVVEAALVRGRLTSVTVRGFANRTYTVSQTPNAQAGDYPDTVDYYRVFSEEYGAEGVFELSTGPSTLVASLEHFYQRNFEVLHFDASESEEWLSSLDEQDAVDGILRGSLHERLDLGFGRLEAGIYGESSRIHGTELAPSLGLVAFPGEGTTVKALYGRGFRRPSFYEYSTVPEAKYDSIRPEVVDSTELFVRQRVGRGISLTANAYRAEYRDFISYRDGQYRNGRDEVLSTGATLGLELRNETGAFRLDGTSQEVRDEDGRPLLGSPPWIGHAEMRLALPREITLGLRASVVGPRRGFGDDRLESSALLDVSLDVPIRAGLRANASVTNAADARFDVPVFPTAPMPYEPREGRWAFLQLVWER